MGRHPGTVPSRARSPCDPAGTGTLRTTRQPDRSIVAQAAAALRCALSPRCSKKLRVMVIAWNCLTVRAQVIAECAEHQTHSPVRRLRRKSRIDADAARDTIAKDTEQGVVRAAYGAPSAIRQHCGPLSRGFPELVFRYVPNDFLTAHARKAPA